MKVNKVFFTENGVSSIMKIIDKHELITEVGGALVGYQELDYIVITHASGPGKNTKMSYDSIEIDGKHATNYCNQLNEVSGHKLYFLGDWHTHLSNNLNPSNRDLVAIKCISKYIPIEYRDSLIAVIINHYEPLETKVYSFDGGRRLKEVLYFITPNPLWIEEYI